MWKLQLLSMTLFCIEQSITKQIHFVKQMLYFVYLCSTVLSKLKQATSYL